MRIASFLMLVALCCPCFAEQLWQNTATGMSPADVIRSYPAAKSVEGARTDRDGSIPLLELTEVSIAGLEFKARFEFVNQKLVKVRLVAQTQTAGETQSGLDRINEALRSKYGPELSRERGLSGKMMTHTFGSGRTSISALGLFIGVPGIVQVLYSVDVAQTADKL